MAFSKIRKKLSSWFSKSPSEVVISDKTKGIRKDVEFKVKRFNRYLFKERETKYTYDQKIEYSHLYYSFQWQQFVNDVKSFVSSPSQYPRLAWALSSLLLFIFLDRKESIFPMLMGAITEDSKTESATDIASTFNVTVANNEDRMMIFGMGHYQGDAGLSGVTYNGDALTIIKDQEGSFEERAQLWGLVNPDTGTNSFVVSGAGDWTGFGVLSAYGCAQRLPTNTHGVSDDTSEALTTTVDGSWVIAAIGAEPTITMTTTNGVEVMNEQGQSFQNAEMHYVVKATAGAQTMSFSLSYGARSNMALCELEPVTADYPEPQIPARETDFATSVTSMSVNMPGAIMSGELLLALVSVRNAGTWTVPSGWTELDAQLGGGSVGELTCFYKIAAGTENGTTPTWTASTGTSAAWLVLRITDWHGTTPPEVTKASGDATNANPPTITASWGSDENLFIAVASNSATTGGFTAAPTNYVNLQSNGASSGGGEVSIALATRKLTSATDDPGTFTPNSNRFWAAMTIVVRPEVSGAADLSVSVSDTVTLSESVDPELVSFVSVSNTVTVSETVDPELISFIFVSNTVTVSETVNIALAHQINVSDTVTLTENVDQELESNVSVGDTITVSETVSLAFDGGGDQSVSESETITVSESIKVELNSFVSESESITVSESVDPELVSFITVSDSISVSEAVNIALVHNVQTSESIFVLEGRNRVTNYSFESDTPGDGVIPSGWTSFNTSGTTAYKGVADDFAKDGVNSFKIEASGAVDTGIRLNVTGFAFGSTLVATVFAKTTAAVDNAALVLSNEQNGSGGSVTVQQNISGATEARMSVSGVMNSTASEIFLGLGAFGSASDGIVWFDDVHVFVFEKVELVSDVRATETVTITESTTVQVPELGGISVSESITVTEATDIDVIVEVSESETINVTDTSNVALVHQISVSDSVSLTESVDPELVSFITVSDAITVSEAVALTFQDFNVSASETITVSEAVSIVVSDVTLEESETITVSESVKVEITSFIAVDDTVTLTEAVDLELVSQPLVSDTVTVSESVKLELNSFISVSDTITVTESVDPETVYAIVVSDTVTLSEAVDLELESNVVVSDTVTITDTVIVTNTELGGISVIDTITVTDTPTMFTDILYLTVSETITVTDISNVAHVLQVRATGETITLSESVAMNPPHIPDPPPTIIYLDDGTPLLRLTGVIYTKI